EYGLTMTSTLLRPTARNVLALSIALAGATLVSAQTPAPPPARSGTTVVPATPDATPAPPDAKAAAPDARPAQRRPRRAPTQAEPEAPSQTAEDSPIAPLNWLEGCW